MSLKSGGGNGKTSAGAATATAALAQPDCGSGAYSTQLLLHAAGTSSGP